MGKMPSKSEILSAAKSVLSSKDYWKILLKTGVFVACVKSKMGNGKSSKDAILECVNAIL